MSKEAMKLALEIAIDYMNDRLEDHDCKYQRHPATEAERINILADIETVKEALEKQEQGEPVAWQDTAKHDELVAAEDWDNIDPQWHWMYRPLYTTPQQRKPLTDEQIDEIQQEWIAKGMHGSRSFARAIEAAHGII